MRFNLTSPAAAAPAPDFARQARCDCRGGSLKAWQNI
jgi:hypothetical protein